MEKNEIISFKVNGALKEALQGIENRSEFIRSAVLAALDGSCPFCKGTGILTPHQRQHWKEIEIHNHFKECDICHGVRLACSHESQPDGR